MTGQKLIIVDSCAECHHGTYRSGVRPGLIYPYCTLLNYCIGAASEKLLDKDTHPDCKLENARGFL